MCADCAEIQRVTYGAPHRGYAAESLRLFRLHEGVRAAHNLPCPPYDARVAKEVEEPERRARWLSQPTVISISCVAIAAGIIVLILRWHEIDFGDLPTWLATVAAIVGGGIALYQLRAQRIALTEEFERQRKRDELLDARLDQSRAEREAMVRAQAEDVELKHARRASEVGPIQIAIVRNNSRRPIRDIRAFLQRPGEAWIPAAALEEVSRPHLVAGSRCDLLRANDRVVFAFDVQVEASPDVRRAVEFRDDNAVMWRIDDDLSLHRIEGFMEI